MDVGAAQEALYRMSFTGGRLWTAGGSVNQKPVSPSEGPKVWTSLLRLSLALTLPSPMLEAPEAVHRLGRQGLLDEVRPKCPSTSQP